MMPVYRLGRRDPHEVLDPMSFTPPPAPAHVAPGPASGGRRRSLTAHLAWEGVLALGVVLMVALVISDGVIPLRAVWPALASTGLVAAGLALSLRCGTPNLMATAAALLAGYLCARLGDGSPSPGTALLAVLLVTAIGLLVGVLDALLAAPSWMLTLGAGVVLQAGVLSQVQQAQVLDGAATGSEVFVVASVGFVVVSVLGGVAFAAPGLRTRMGGVPGRPAPLGRRLERALLGVGGSTLAYAVGGVLLVLYTRTVVVGGDRLTLALGIVLLAGVSPWGRRGGIAGVVLSTVLLVLLTLWSAVHGLEFWVSGLLVPGLAVLVGLVVCRVLDRAAGPDPVE